MLGACMVSRVGFGAEVLGPCPWPCPGPPCCCLMRFCKVANICGFPRRDGWLLPICACIWAASKITSAAWALSAAGTDAVDALPELGTILIGAGAPGKFPPEGLFLADGALLTLFFFPFSPPLCSAWICVQIIFWRLWATGRKELVPESGICFLHSLSLTLVVKYHASFHFCELWS